MKSTIKNQIFVSLSAFLLIVPFAVSAEAPGVRFNQENWTTLPHPKVASFTIRPDGSAYGTTTTSIPFRQYNVPNDLGLRIQRFEIQDHYHYVVEGRIVYTLSEVSAQLALATQ